MTPQWSARLAARPPVLPVVEELGRDWALAPNQLSAGARTNPDVVRAAWSLYDRYFTRFCGAQLDPQFWRLEHPGSWRGTPIVTDGAPIVIVGTGPSMRSGLDELRRHRHHVHLVTSPRGADALEDAGLVPDVVLIEHQTPVDAQFSVQALKERRRDWRSRVALVVTDARTPAALVGDLPTDRLLTLDPLPTWGLWPATAAAMAVSAGAATVALLGVDLGTRDRPDARQNAMRDLLSLVVLGTPIACVDLGIEGSRKTGWTPGHLSTFVGSSVRQPLAVLRVASTTPEERRLKAVAAWRRTASLAGEALVTLDAACRVRGGDHSPRAVAGLERGLTGMLDRSRDPVVRQDVQDGLGCTFLPRYWRAPPDLTLGASLWRPAALAAHELVHQFRALDRRLRASGFVA